jgi:DNA repair protein RecO (recombination protein O)
MIWDNTGFLLSKNKYNENSLIVEIFTQNYGKVPGIIFGGTSKKLKNYLQIGNQLYVNYNSKSENKIGYFKTEIQRAYSPIYFDSQHKLSCIRSSMNLLKLLTAEFQANEKIFDLINKFYLIISKENWLKEFIFWELDLLKVLGYDLDFKNLVTKETIGNKIIYYAISSKEKKIVPNFLIDKNDAVNDIETLLNGLKLISDYLDKSILKPNNLNYPHSRTHFVNSLK